MKHMDHETLIRRMEAEENKILNEVDQALIRIFKKATHKAWMEGDYRNLYLYSHYLERAKEL